MVVVLNVLVKLDYTRRHWR